MPVTTDGNFPKWENQTCQCHDREINSTSLICDWDQEYGLYMIECMVFMLSHLIFPFHFFQPVKLNAKDQTSIAICIEHWNECHYLNLPLTSKYM